MPNKDGPTKKQDYLFKMIIIGNSGVGKSCLMRRVTTNEFSEDHEVTVGVEFGSLLVKMEETVLKLQIWDTAGQERFKTITSSYYKGAHGIIVTYDITDRESFSAIENWMNEVEKHASDNISRILVGNKSDMIDAKQISSNEGRQLAERYNARFIETSAKNSKNVEEAFILLVSQLL